MRESYKKWLEDDKPKIFCYCSCGQEINITDLNKYNGIPKYIHGHNLGRKSWNLGHIPWNKGKKLSVEHIQKLSESHKNKRHPESQKQKISKSLIGIKRSKETIQKLSGKNHHNFNDWASRKPYCEKWEEKLREEIRNKYDRKCYLCGKNEKDNITVVGKIRRLSIHHIDSDKEQGCNGKEWKLVPLCLRCHNSKKSKVLL